MKLLSNSRGRMRYGKKTKSEHKLGMAVLAGVIVGCSGAAVDMAVIPFEKVVIVHQLIGDLISALVAVLVCLALLLKFEEMHYRFAMERAGIVAELNHHVRNAVFPLCLAVQRLGDAESNRIANEAVERINIALKDAAADAFARKVDYGEQITSFTTEKAA